MDPLVFRILVALRSGDADGTSLLARLSSDDNGPAPSLPTLYRCLRTCKDNAWIEETTAVDAGPGRPPKTFALAAEGEKAVAEEAHRHLRLAELVLGSESRTNDR